MCNEQIDNPDFKDDVDWNMVKELPELMANMVSADGHINIEARPSGFVCLSCEAKDREMEHLQKTINHLESVNGDLTAQIIKKNYCK